MYDEEIDLDADSERLRVVHREHPRETALGGALGEVRSRGRRQRQQVGRYLRIRTGGYLQGWQARGCSDARGLEH